MTAADDRLAEYLSVRLSASGLLDSDKAGPGDRLERERFLYQLEIAAVMEILGAALARHTGPFTSMGDENKTLRLPDLVQSIVDRDAKLTELTREAWEAFGAHHEAREATEAGR